MIRFRALAPLFLLLSACSPMAAFDSVVPKDRGTVRVARDQPFREGRRGKLDVYAPRQANADGQTKLPVIVFFYGGSWRGGTKDGYGFVGRALAAEGFIAVLPDYRLVPEVRFPTFVEDGAAAVRWVRANIGRFGGDPDRIVVAGHSAGAYNAAMLALDPRWLGAERRAVRGLAAMAGPYDFLPLDTEVTKDAFAGVGDLKATQPPTFASKDDPPALLLHGAADRLVLPAHSVALATALTEAGTSAETRLYPGIGHVGILTALARPWRGKAPVLRDLSAFARRVTGGNDAGGNHRPEGLFGGKKGTGP